MCAHLPSGYLEATFLSSLKVDGQRLLGLCFLPASAASFLSLRAEAFVCTAAHLLLLPL